MISLQELFPVIDDTTDAKLQQFLALIQDWNQKINLVSRKDIENLVPHHLIPSLAISHACQFAEGTEVLDVGTGGGFPGIPLSICFPKTNFLLIDSILKKVNVVQDMATNLGLKNVRTEQIRVENLNKKFDFVIGRAVTALPTFLGWIAKNLRPGSNSSLSNGVLYIKGQDFEVELKDIGLTPTKVFRLEDYFQGQFCKDKHLLYFSTESVSHLVE